MCEAVLRDWTMAMWPRTRVAHLRFRWLRPRAGACVELGDAKRLHVYWVVYLYEESVLYEYRYTGLFYHLRRYAR